MHAITSTILESMSDGVLVFDFSGPVIFWNPAALELLGLAEQDLEHKRYIDFFRSEQGTNEFNELLIAWIQNRKIQVCRDITFLRTDGKQLELAVTTSFLDPRDGEETNGVVAVFRDITEAKALERARQRIIDHLAHELKTPLAVIRAAFKRINRPDNQVLLERIGNNLGRLQDIQVEVEQIARQGFMKTQKGSASLTDGLIDLLDIVTEGNSAWAGPIDLLKSEIKELFPAYDPRPQLIGIADPVRVTVSEVQRLASHRQVELQIGIEDDPRVWIDPEALRKVLTALLKNAVEATPDGGMVAVSYRSRDGRIVIDIHDTGIGITTESQTQIFGGFYSAKDTFLYSTKRPFDFGAGGKGLDLLRLKILSRTYNFEVACESRRCRHIPAETDLCPGSIDLCTAVRNARECAQAGGTTFSVTFPC